MLVSEAGIMALDFISVSRTRTLLWLFLTGLCVARTAPSDSGSATYPLSGPMDMGPHKGSRLSDDELPRFRNAHVDGDGSSERTRTRASSMYETTRPRSHRYRSTVHTAHSIGSQTYTTTQVEVQ
ncbi:hypothetical protein R1flu_026658 [Riccia fluitans]|uniref:Secreted protein n=1 Tax=Riccia fluitans TaxID=41844 RepID=A0ABD1XGM7_9MARC